MLSIEKDNLMMSLAEEFITKLQSFEESGSYPEHVIAKYCYQLRKSLTNKYVSETKSNYKSSKILLESKIHEIYMTRMSENGRSNIDI